jgi:hypothetical protein
VLILISFLFEIITLRLVTPLTPNAPIIHFCVFADGASCPYRDTPLGNIRDCPAFRTGCPFKECKSIHEIRDLLATMPHGGGANKPGEKEVLAMMRSVHHTSEKLRQNLGACPVFKNGCPMASSRPVLAASLVTSQSSPTSHEAFSAQIKEGTKTSHKAAENVHFVKEFLKGNIQEDLYKQLIADLYHVYLVLER